MARVDRTAYDLITDDGPLRLPALPPPAEATVGDWPRAGRWKAITRANRSRPARL